MLLVAINTCLSYTAPGEKCGEREHQVQQASGVEAKLRYGWSPHGKLVAVVVHSNSQQQVMF